MTPGNTQAVQGKIATFGSDSHARASSLAATRAVSDKNQEDKAKYQGEYKGDRCCAFDRRVNQCTRPVEIH